MGNRNNKRKYKDREQKEKNNERIRWYKTIKGLLKDRKLSRALTEIEEYTNLYPDDCFGQLLYGTILTNIKEIQKAKNVYQHLIDIEAKNMYTAMYYMACIEKSQGNIASTKELLSRCIKESPYEEDFSKIELARIEREIGNFEVAEELLQTISLEHEDYKKLEITKIKLLQNKNIEAYNLINTIQESDNKIFNRQIYYEKGRVELSFSNYKKAREYFEEVLKGPKSGIYYLALVEIAKIEIYEGYPLKACEICNSILGKNEHLKGEVYYVLAFAYETLKDYDKARDLYNKMITYNKTRTENKVLLALGKLEFKLDHYDEAINYLNQIQEEKNYVKGALFNMVYIEMRRENYHQASLYLEELKKKNLLEDDFDISAQYRTLRIFLDKKLKVPLSIDDFINYGEEQYASYSKKKAIEHIQKEHFNNKLKNKSNFYEHIIIESLIDEIKDKLTKDNLCIRDRSDAYLVDYENIGITKNGEEANCLKVITIPNTKDIITMYPELKWKGNNINEEPKHKEKRLSQIEKFNKKYNLK